LPLAAFRLLRKIGGDEGPSIIENGKIKFLKNDKTQYSDIVCVDNQNHIFSAAKTYLNIVMDDSIKMIYSFDNDYIMSMLPYDSEHLSLLH
jgi:hypothetical protein